MTRNGPGAGVRGFLRVPLLLATVAVAASTIFLGCDGPVDPPPIEPPPIEPPPTDPAPAFEAYLRDGTENAFTGRAVDEVLAAIPADEIPAFLAELGQIDLDGRMSAMIANYSFRRLLRVTFSIYDAEYGSPSRQAISQPASARAVAPLADEEYDPFDDLDYVERVKAYIRKHLKRYEEEVDRIREEAFGKPVTTKTVAGKCIRRLPECYLWVAVFLGELFHKIDRDLARDETIDRPEGSYLDDWLEEFSRCSDFTGRCEQDTDLDPPPEPPPPEPPGPEPPPLAFPVSALPDRDYVVGTPIEPVVFPEATGGVPPIRYRCRFVGEGLGLQFHGRTLSGTPSQEGIGKPYCIASDAEDGLARLSFTFNVMAAPLAFIGSIPDQDYVVDTPVEVLALPEAHGGTPPLEYEMIGTPYYPPGLSLTYDEGSGTYFLEGTPTKAGEYLMTWRVTDAEDRQDELRFTVRVTAAVPPLEFVGRIADQHDYVVGALVRIKLPRARGGTPPLVPRVSSRPPSPWLKWSERHLLEGTPTEPGEFRLTYRVTDANGKQIESQFTVTVTEGSTSTRLSVEVAALLIEPPMDTIVLDEPSKECNEPSWAAKTVTIDYVDRKQYYSAAESSYWDVCENIGGNRGDLCRGSMIADHFIPYDIGASTYGHSHCGAIAIATEKRHTSLYKGHCEVGASFIDRDAWPNLSRAESLSEVEDAALRSCKGFGAGCRVVASMCLAFDRVVPEGVEPKRAGAKGTGNSTR